MSAFSSGSCPALAREFGSAIRYLVFGAWQEHPKQQGGSSKTVGGELLRGYAEMRLRTNDSNGVA